MDARTEQAIRKVASNESLLDMLSKANKSILHQALQETIGSHWPTRNQWDFLSRVIPTEAFATPIEKPLERVHHLFRDELLEGLEDFAEDALQVVIQREVRNRGLTFNQRDYMNLVCSLIVTITAVRCGCAGLIGVKGSPEQTPPQD